MAGTEARALRATGTCSSGFLAWRSSAWSSRRDTLHGFEQSLFMCPSKVGTGKCPDLSDLTLAKVASLSHLLRVSRLDLRLARARFKMNTLEENVSLDNKEQE